MLVLQCKKALLDGFPSHQLQRLDGLPVLPQRVNRLRQGVGCLLLCLALGWLITNGWSYIMFGIGTYLEINWMVAVSGAYLAFLWLPISPEKLVTFAIAIALLRWLFPGDQKTLAVLHRWYEKTRAAVNRHRERRAEEKAAQE